MWAPLWGTGAKAGQCAGPVEKDIRRRSPSLLLHLPIWPPTLSDMIDNPVSSQAATAESFQNRVLDASAQQPVLVDFWADWCAPCKALDPVLARIAAQLGDQVRIVKINADEEAGLVSQLGVRGLPTLLLFSGGRPVEQLVGAQPEGPILAMIEPYLVTPADKLIRAAADHLERGERTQAQQLLESAVTLQPDNAAALRALIPLVAISGQLDEARRLHGQLIRTDRESPWGIALATLIEIAERAGHAPSTDALRSRLDEEPMDSNARADLAARHVVAGEYREALDNLIELLRSDRAFCDELPRRALLAVFELEGDQSSLTQDYRRKMAAALH